jgi:glycosyltransferase involved in cell wall biosynthesis
MLPKNIFGKIQMRIVAHTADYLIFISENEKKLWEETYPRSKKVPQSVIYNFFETPTAIDRKDVLSDYKDKFKLASLSTISGRRGTDRLIDVAEALEKKGSHNVLFVICGKGKASYIDSLKSSIKTKSLEDSFLFLGHQEFPEFILSECDALIKLPRTYNPWGRNVIEAMMCGRPVISLGTYNRFITDGVNGYLLPEFNPEDIAERIIYLYDHPEVVQKMGRVNIDKGRLLFDAATNIFKINRVYEELTAQ